MLWYLRNLLVEGIQSGHHIAERAEFIETEGLSPAVLASVGSVALALSFYYVRGDKQRGQFVGFWPVTILAMASYFKLEEIKQMLAGDNE